MWSYYDLRIFTRVFILESCACRACFITINGRYELDNENSFVVDEDRWIERDFLISDRKLYQLVIDWYGTD